MRTTILLLCFLYWTNISAQEIKKVKLIIVPEFSGKEIKNTSLLRLNYNDSIQLETLKFYISGLALLKDENVLWQEQNSFHLVDLNKASQLKLILDVPSNQRFNKLTFNLGIDSITNVSGALGGDLDPTNGMYWTWQSGYINFKLEGKSNLCTSRKNEFQFHLGGYLYPYNSLQKVELAVPSQDSIALVFDLKKLLSEIDFSNNTHIMSPGKSALELSKKVANAFYLKP